MLNLCTTILNYTEEMPEEYYNYGYVTHIIYGKHYPNGGWMSVNVNDYGVTSSGSWPLLTPCIKKIASSNGWILYFDYGDNESGLNVAGAPVQEKWWNKPYTYNDMISKGFKPGKYCRNFLISFACDAWNYLYYEITYKQIEQAVESYFRNNNGNKDYQYSIPHSYSANRGSGSNPVPTFTARWYMTVFEDKM